MSRAEVCLQCSYIWEDHQKMREAQMRFPKLDALRGFLWYARDLNLFLYLLSCSIPHVHSTTTRFILKVYGY